VFELAGFRNPRTVKAKPSAVPPRSRRQPAILELARSQPFEPTISRLGEGHFQNPALVNAMTAMLATPAEVPSSANEDNSEKPAKSSEDDDHET